MFYAAFKDGNGKEHSNLYFAWWLFHQDTFSPDTEFLTIIDFKIRAGSYREKQEQARQLAITFQSEQRPGLSWEELAAIQSYFAKIGKRYGLLTEFQENGIC